MLKKTNSMRFLLPISMIALGTILLLIVSIALWTIQNNTQLTKTYLNREGHLITEGLANSIATSLVNKDYAELETRLLQSASSQNVHSILVINTKGQVLSHVVGRLEDIPAHPDFTLKHLEPPVNVQDVSEKIYPNFLQIWHSIELGTTIGWVRVEIELNKYTYSIEEMQRRTWLLAIIVAILGVFLVGMAILRSYRLLYQHETKERTTRRKLETKAYYDDLTHLPNRALLYDRLDQCIARNERNNQLLAVCFADLDKFKPINDNYGHEVGDHVLVEVAHRLLSVVRAEDTVARQGGDEFVILLGGLNNELEATMAVERLITSLNQPMLYQGKTLEIEGSIGYVIYPNDCTDVKSLIELADKSMYEAKTDNKTHIKRYTNI